MASHKRIVSGCSPLLEYDPYKNDNQMEYYENDNR
jgi:hypothetical protein